MLEIKAIIFDLDGVIINSEPLHEEAKRHTFEAYEIQVPASVFTEFKGKTDHDVLSYVAEHFAEGTVSAEELIQAKQDAYRRLQRGKLQIVSGATDFLDHVSQLGLKLALATSAVRENQQIAFDRFGLAPYFEAVTTAEDVVNPKPAPDPYRDTAQKIGVEPGTCLVIEDSDNGVLSARAAGCRVAAVTTTFRAARLEEAGADVVVETFDELRSWLDRQIPAATI